MMPRKKPVKVAVPPLPPTEEEVQAAWRCLSLEWQTSLVNIAKMCAASGMSMEEAIRAVRVRAMGNLFGI